MRQSVRLMFFALALLIPTGRAMAETAQQMKMQVCNDEASAKQMSGDARKEFMKACLSKGSGNAQQDRMRACNAQAKSKALSGEARKEFMKTCLSSQ